MAIVTIIHIIQSNCKKPSDITTDMSFIWTRQTPHRLLQTMFWYFALNDVNLHRGWTLSFFLHLSTGDLEETFICHSYNLQWNYSETTELCRPIWGTWAPVVASSGFLSSLIRRKRGNLREMPFSGSTWEQTGEPESWKGQNVGVTPLVHGIQISGLNKKAFA